MARDFHLDRPRDGMGRTACVNAASMILAGLFVALAGCSQGVRVGPWQVIEPEEPLHATRIEVIRGVVVVEKKHATPRSSRLTVDLVNGRASFAAHGEEAYPIAIDPDMLEALRSSIADRSWQVKEIEPAKELTRAMVYEMTVFVGAEEVKHVARWHVPSEREVPSSLGQVTLVFNDAMRAADPLSNRFDLLD